MNSNTGRNASDNRKVLVTVVVADSYYLKKLLKNNNIKQELECWLSGDEKKTYDAE